MNVLKKDRDVHSNREGWHDLLDTTLQLLSKIRRDEASHWRGAPGVDGGLDRFNHGGGRAMGEPERGALTGEAHAYPASGGAVRPATSLHR